jgi:SAM-dependent methyltransferase
VKSWLYDTMYRFGAPWDGVGVREDLIELIKSGLVDPDRYPRSIDLGCGTGANVVYLAEQGFDSHGVDYSRIAIDKARARAADAGVDVGLVVGDLTARSLPGLEGSFDFLVDFGTLDDLRGRDRVAMARLATDLARPGACFLEWCFYGETATLPGSASEVRRGSATSPRVSSMNCSATHGPSNPSRPTHGGGRPASFSLDGDSPGSPSQPWEAQAIPLHRRCAPLPSPLKGVLSRGCATRVSGAPLWLVCWQSRREHR